MFQSNEEIVWTVSRRRVDQSGSFLGGDVMGRKQRHRLPFIHRMVIKFTIQNLVTCHIQLQFLFIQLKLIKFVFEKNLETDVIERIDGKRVSPVSGRVQKRRRNIRPRIDIGPARNSCPGGSKRPDWPAKSKASLSTR